MKRLPPQRKTPAAEAVRLRREIRQTREQCMALLGDAVRRTDYDRWKASVDERIAVRKSAIRGARSRSAG